MLMIYGTEILGMRTIRPSQIRSRQTPLVALQKKHLGAIIKYIDLAGNKRLLVNWDLRAKGIYWLNPYNLHNAEVNIPNVEEFLQ